LGISKLSAKSAVIETALSRSALTIFCTSTPAIIMTMLTLLKKVPKNKFGLKLTEISCITAGLLFGVPFSVSIFPPVSKKQGKELEPEFHPNKEVFFSKGL